MNAKPNLKVTTTLESIELTLSPRQAYLVAILAGGAFKNNSEVEQYANHAPMSLPQKMENIVLKPFDNQDDKELNQLYQIISDTLMQVGDRL